MAKKHIITAVLAIVIIAVYFILIRAKLKATMGTVPIELTIGIISILALLTSFLIMVVMIIITIGVLLFTRKKAGIKPWILKIRRQLIITFTLLFMLGIVTVSSQHMTYTPPIVCKGGKVVSGSIAELRKVKLNGSNEWITIRGKNKDKPILLFLAGGPGGTLLSATRIQLKALEDNFVVVNWDQPGAGKSCNAVKVDFLTPKRYVSDAYELTKYLCQRFNKKKIYVCGESWGSALGIMLVKQHPELFSAFVGTGQMISFTDTELYDYNTAIKMAKENGDSKVVEKLKKQSLPPYYGNGAVLKAWTYYSYLDECMQRNKNIWNSGYSTFSEMAGPEYGLYDKLNYILGMIKTYDRVYPQLYGIDFRKQDEKIDVPVYIFQGRHDINAPTEFVQEYYDKLKAPSKKLIWFEHSGHDTWRNENKKFCNTMINVLLK
ncbi:alpha/beta fold hydrolase [Clostridium hydrogenum]|uniref:alpha/beta fold hydrolase n=1 Tax=Clostridium hydrogenum TaxID=2855764 RepID=UPI001F208842|nr:alpha/beta hydrolase [Clostridium hydrogenum]